MRVLIAIDDTQRPAHAAEHLAVEGELVTPVVVGCDVDDCPTCQGAWFGLVSHGPTATAMVVDRPGVTEHDLRHRIHDWLDCIGVVDRVVQVCDAGDRDAHGRPLDDAVAAVDELVDEHLHEIREICSTYAVGTVVSRLGHLVAPCGLDVAA